MERFDWKIYFANMALQASRRATCPKQSVGAVIVKNNMVLSTGYNGAPKGMSHCFEVGCKEDSSGHCCRSVHAEANAIMQARGVVGGAEIYCTHVPCIECCKLIINAGIKKVYWIHDYFDSRCKAVGCVSQIDFLYDAGVIAQEIKEHDAYLASSNFTFDILKKNCLDNCKEIVEKPWGQEVIIDANDKYAFKMIYVNAGERLSLQYHVKKKETMFFVSGTGLLQLGDHTFSVMPGSIYTIEPNLRHRVIASSSLVFFEASTSELNDVVRLLDIYDRL